MKAILVDQPGGPEAMTLRELPDPQPGPGQARVRVELAGVNYIDVYQRTGLYPRPAPIALGLEGAGVVEAIGPEVHALAIGDRVAWHGVPGSYATHVLAPAGRLVPIPGGVNSRDAAAAMLQGMTAHYLTRSTYRLGAGDTCLVHAAAGGTGMLICQLGARAGARVIGTASTADKAARARAAGADEVILYGEVDFADEVLRLTAGDRVQVVYDSVGQATFARGLDCLAPRGMMVLFGQSSGPVAPIDPLELSRKGSLYLTRPALDHHVADRDELVARATDVFDWVRAGELRLTIDRVLPLAEAAQAHRLLEGRQTSGKLLLDTGAS